MTVQDLIDALNQVEDKQKLVKVYDHKRGGQGVVAITKDVTIDRHSIGSTYDRSFYLDIDDPLIHHTGD